MRRRAMLAMLPATALAQGEVNRLVVTNPPGAASDAIARLVAEAAARAGLGTTVVENRPGANGNIAAGLVARARPDGRTLLVALDTTFTVGPHVYANLGFDPAALEPVAMLGHFPLTLLVSPGSGIRDIAGLAAATGGQGLLYVSAGAGSPGHLGMEALRLRLGLPASGFTHVPMRGNAEVVAELLAGRVQAGMVAIGGGVQVVQEGRIRALATAGQSRDPLLPEVPTLAEAGLSDLVVRFGFTLSVPRGTPDAIRAAWLAATHDAFNSGRGRIAGFGVVPEVLDAAATQAWITQAHGRWGVVAREAGMRVD